MFAPRIFRAVKIFIFTVYVAFVVKCSINIKKKFIAMKRLVLTFHCFKEIITSCFKKLKYLSERGNILIMNG